MKKLRTITIILALVSVALFTKGFGYLPLSFAPECYCVHPYNGAAVPEYENYVVNGDRMRCEANCQWSSHSYINGIGHCAEKDGFLYDYLMAYGNDPSECTAWTDITDPTSASYFGRPDKLCSSWTGGGFYVESIYGAEVFQVDHQNTYLLAPITWHDTGDQVCNEVTDTLWSCKTDSATPGSWVETNLPCTSPVECVQDSDCYTGVYLGGDCVANKCVYPTPEPTPTPPTPFDLSNLRILGALLTALGAVTSYVWGKP